LDTRINDRDIKHLHSFPGDRKSVLMRRIMSQRPDRTVKLTGKDDFEKQLLKLREDGYKLIDLQRHEHSFSSTWYRRGVSLLGRERVQVTMLVWEQDEPGSSTTVLTWRV
jgi:hypothetical protein